MKLVDIIRNDIENNKIVEDGKLPTLQQLAVRYQCGTTSVKRAFDLLEQDGIIRVVRGRGRPAFFDIKAVAGAVAVAAVALVVEAKIG